MSQLAPPREPFLISAPLQKPVAPYRLSCQALLMLPGAHLTPGGSPGSPQVGDLERVSSECTEPTGFQSPTATGVGLKYSHTHNTPAFPGRWLLLLPRQLQTPGGLFPVEATCYTKHSWPQCPAATVPWSSFSIFNIGLLLQKPPRWPATAQRCRKCESEAGITAVEKSAGQEPEMKVCLVHVI